MDLTAASFSDARAELHRVVVHVLARARVQASGRFSLRVTPGGVGTPDLPGERRVRVAGGSLLVETDDAGSPAVRVRPIAGSTLRELAELAGVDLDVPLDVGHDTPPVGDVDRPIVLDGAAAVAVALVFGDVAEVLDRLVAAVAAEGTVAPITLPRLWPEHFDVAVEVEQVAGRRVNLGGSPGDGFVDEPYLYVGPWTADRPGDAAFWNAPFGAFMVLAGTTVEERVGFLVEGLRRLRA